MVKKEKTDEDEPPAKRKRTRERQQRDRTLGSRGSDALVRLSDVLAYAAEYRAHTPHGVMP